MYRTITMYCTAAIIPVSKRAYSSKDFMACGQPVGGYLLQILHINTCWNFPTKEAKPPPPPQPKSRLVAIRLQACSSSISTELIFVYNCITITYPRIPQKERSKITFLKIQSLFLNMIGAGGYKKVFSRALLAQSHVRYLPPPLPSFLYPHPLFQWVMLGLQAGGLSAKARKGQGAERCGQNRLGGRALRLEKGRGVQKGREEGPEI